MLIDEYIVTKASLCFDLMHNKKKHFSSAESCTAGLLAFVIALIPGASTVFDRTIISYSVASKIELLGVKASTIDAFTVVSEQVADEMVYGLVAMTNSEVVVAITGEVGPTTSSGVEVGIVYISMLVDGKLIKRRLELPPSLSRLEMQVEVVKEALDLIYTSLTEK